MFLYKRIKRPSDSADRDLYSVVSYTFLSFVLSFSVTFNLHIDITVFFYKLHSSQFFNQLFTTMIELGFRVRANKTKNQHLNSYKSEQYRFRFFNGLQIFK